MGNCILGGLGPEPGDHHQGDLTKVITANGAVMEFYTPVAAGPIMDQFPGHAIFRNHDLFWKSLAPHEELKPGESYYLLPFNTPSIHGKCGQVVREGHVRSKSIPSSALAPTYRMSVEYQGALKRSYTEVFSRSSHSNGNNNNGGVWKVKLVISPEQLVEILSQETRTQELIESVRAVAKCGSGATTGSSFTGGGFSDQWSLSSSRNDVSWL